MSKNTSEKQALILGALLHDVGKFMQRAEEKYSKEYDNLLQLCCPKYIDKYKGEEYTHQHVLWSGNFIKDLFENTQWAKAENLALYHHLPESAKDKYLTKIITLADWLSAGERKERETDVGEVKKEPLVCIFSQIKNVKESITFQQKDWYHKLTNLEINRENLFPKRNKKEAIDETSYPNLWRKFKEETDLLKNFYEFDTLLNALYSLLQKYTIFIPSAGYKDIPDVSLFDHSKTTCAISVCLYDEKIEEDKLDKVLKVLEKVYKKSEITPEEENILKEERFLLVAGDISGIQDFIYSVSGKGTVKGLRGRSLYLQLLSEVVAKYILHNLNLPITNLLYCGGGHFYLIVSKKAEEKLKELEEKINKNILNAHKGKLSLIISWVNLSFLDFNREKFGDKWQEIGLKLANKKRKKFHQFLDKDYDNIFGPFEEGGIKDVCKICGEEAKEITDDKCILCESFETLAEELGKSKYLEELEFKPSELKEKIKNYKNIINSFGYEYKFIEKVDSPKNTYLLNDVEILKNNTQKGMKFIAKYTPYVNDKIKEFELLSKEATGIKRWGIIRADVDDLGKIFEKGLGENRTISRISMLSSLISIFFSGWIDKIAESYKDKVYVIYSGGDDLFIIGAWAILPELAEKIYNDFREFTCNNPHITLSTGIFISPSDKFPAYKAAESSGDAENKAKKKGKDRITFLDEAMNWNNEFQEVKMLKDRIVKLLQEDKLPRALLQILLSSYEEQKLFKEGKDSMFRIWRALYSFKRLKERYKNVIDKLDELEKAIIINNELKPFLNISVRWAEFLTRKEEE